MDIVFTASECSPWAKTGGLADVVGALPVALVKLGHRVRTFLPYYRQVAKQAPNAPVVLASVTIPFGGFNRFASILDGGLVKGVQYYFVDCPELFDREGIYGTIAGEYRDNAERYALLCRAVLESVKILGVPDVFHVHDWQAAILSIMLHSTYYFDPLLGRVPSVLTIHNAGYQGWFPPATMERLLLPWDMFTVDRLESYDKVNFLKGGLVYSDLITTVSPTYAVEIQTPEGGNGLDDRFRQRRDDLRGILNGVDYTEWDPAVDPQIAAHYSVDDLAGKLECRRDLLHAYGADDVADSTAVLGVVSRFATQKGFDLLNDILPQLMEQDVIVIVLGSGEEYYENLMREMAHRYPTKLRLKIMYDDVLAHKVEAGSDMLLMPSRYEPCGLNQIYSLRYGTVPVVRATGGLQDTIDEQPDGGGNGFKFWGFQTGDFLAAIYRALEVFRDKEKWHAVMRRGMAQNFSWDEPAKQYVEVYERAVRQRS